jgi:(p)ppGpp synthase/HD superfamily hydrolase
VNRLSAAIALAAREHSHQLDKSGRPYILHALRVMLAVEPFGDDYMIAGVLHDVVEDTPVTLREIAFSFGVDTAATVDAMTRRKGEVYRDYIERVLLNFVARTVKIADLHDNMNETRMEGLDSAMRESLTKRYEWALRRLTEGA